MYKNFGKRLLDVILASVALVACFPIILVAIAVLLITSKESPFYSHQRPGFKERPFILYKLRTMKNVPEGKATTSNLSRITRFGALLRATSIDELPQLINVLKGDLSLIGPRPLEMRYLPHYNDQQRRRHDVKPGITGLAQVSGRNELSWEEKFVLDIQYVENISAVLDFKILLKTIRKVFLMAGVNSGSSSQTVEPFVPRSGAED